MTDSPNEYLSCKGFHAWIVVDHKPLPHFGVEHNELTSEASAWIPSEAGKVFNVYYRKVIQDNNGYKAKLKLDGHTVVRRIHNSKSRIPDVKNISFVEVSPTETRAFIFNPITLTDEDEYLDHPSSTGIGEIKLVLRYAKIVDTSSRPVRFRDVQTETQKVHERSKKGLVHQIKFSETKSRKYYAPSKIISKSTGKPITFIFKYRSLDILQANGIAHRPKAPVDTRGNEPRSSPAQASVEKPEKVGGSKPVMSNALKREDGNDEEEDGDDVDDEINKREQALEAELQEVRNQKRARQETRRPVKKVKTESTIHFRPREIIDLTEELPKKWVKTESADSAVIDLT